jgi:hypothetical protein
VHSGSPSSLGISVRTMPSESSRKTAQGRPQSDVTNKAIEKCFAPGHGDDIPSDHQTSALHAVLSGPNVVLSQCAESRGRVHLSNECVEITDNGLIKLGLKANWSDGTPHLVSTPVEFLEKLAALVSPPGRLMVRWGGVFAPNSPYRKDITLKPDIKKGLYPTNEAFGDETGQAEKVRSKRDSWAKMLARVFKIDITKCSSCGGQIRFVCAVMESRAIRRYFEHIGIDLHPPYRAAPRGGEARQGEFDSWRASAPCEC